MRSKFDYPTKDSDPKIRPDPRSYNGKTHRPRPTAWTKETTRRSEQFFKSRRKRK